MPYSLTPLPDSILLATSNAKKIVEMERVLARLGIAVHTPKTVTCLSDVEETGSTFMENAEIKATAQAKHTGLWAIGEDSGLCVDALQGGPGIYSARFAGDDATDEKNNDLLLEKLKEIPLERRGAHYVSTIVLSDPEGRIHLRAMGECHGRVLFERRGDGGFGYDPLFEVIEYHQTFAQLGRTVKNAISHRGRALRQFIELLSCSAGRP